MLRTNTEYAEWLINRAMVRGENRKMKRALNASLRRARMCQMWEQAALARRELRKLTRNMRKYRTWVAKKHPGATVSIKITNREPELQQPEASND